MITELERCLYQGFSHDIDEYMLQLKINKAETSENSIYHRIMCDGIQVGFILIIEGYIDSAYVTPTYRRRGLARQAINDICDSGIIPARLHIIKTNKPAIAFWNSVFDLVSIDESFCDDLYCIRGRKNG